MSSVGPQRVLMIALGGFSIAALFVWYLKSKKRRPAVLPNGRQQKRPSKEEETREERALRETQLEAESSDSKGEESDEQEQSEPETTDLDENEKKEEDSNEEVQQQQAESEPDETDSGNEHIDSEPDKEQDEVIQNEDVEDAFLSQRVETDQAVRAEIVAEHVENRGDEASEKEDSVSSTASRNEQKQEEKITRPSVSEEERKDDEVVELKRISVDGQAADSSMPKCMISSSSSSETETAKLNASDVVKIPELTVLDEQIEQTPADDCGDTLKTTSKQDKQERKKAKKEKEQEKEKMNPLEMPSPSLILDVDTTHQSFSWSEEMANSPPPMENVQPSNEQQEQRESPGAISQNSECLVFPSAMIIQQPISSPTRSSQNQHQSFQAVTGAPLIRPITSIPTHLPPPKSPNYQVLSSPMSHLSIDPYSKPYALQPPAAMLMRPPIIGMGIPMVPSIMVPFGTQMGKLPMPLPVPVFRPVSIKPVNNVKVSVTNRLDVVISPVEEKSSSGNSNSDGETTENFPRTNSTGSSMCVPSTSSSCSPSENASSGDSGRATGGLASSLSPMDDQSYLDSLPMYEFEIPNSLVGLIIGIKGKTIRELSIRTNVKMLIRQHHTQEKLNTHQICQVRGKREEINHCLSMLRRRFPPPRFPELNLNPVLPPMLSNGLLDTLHAQPTWLTLPENVPCEVVVSSIISPSHFFLQQPTHPSYASLTLLDMYMLRLYSQDVDIPELPAPCQDGLLCAAPVGSNWLRAVTFGFDADKDEVSIRYVDYGGYGRLKRNQLRQIRTDLMSLPFQSTECYLAYVQPVDGTRMWCEEATEFFKNFVLGRLITATLVGYHVEDRMPMIELVVQNEDKKAIRIDAALMDRGYAKAADPSKMQKPNQTPRTIHPPQQPLMNGGFSQQMTQPPPPLGQLQQNHQTPNHPGHHQMVHQNGHHPPMPQKRPTYSAQFSHSSQGSAKNVHHNNNPGHNPHKKHQQQF
ncbi:hypothetical protein WR25_04695 [Diploscapter pachys]|uniref:Tudor domain-containing protein n=1 Tax=Diploscapter pachys TaxID=2018661 RepID=A0A2A2J671_9BILA|nr:hypothetical protein WR25_04695 [Diploscapter pachys]